MLMAVVLIVDDDVKIIELLQLFLKQQGHQVAVAGDAYSAMQAFQQHKPQLVILDFQMPAGSGADVYHKLRGLAAGAALPVIFLSGTSKYQIQQAVPEGPNVKFLEKPVDFKALGQSLAELLGPSPSQPKAAPPPPDDDSGPTVLDLDAP